MYSLRRISLIRSAMKAKINKDSATPMYRQVADRIRADIKNGIYKVDEKIPSELELIDKYDVSRITIRKAVEALVDEGILTRHQGKGTFVTIPSIDVDVKPVTSFNDACLLRGSAPSSKVLAARTIKASQEDMDELGVKDNARIVEIDRLRMADEVPVILERNHFSIAFSYLLESNLSGSLYSLLRGYGIEPTKASRDISIVNADENKANLLGVEIGSPLLFLHEVIYDQKGRPLHISHQYIRGDIFKLKL